MRSASKLTFLFCILQNGRFMNNCGINSLQAKFMPCHWRQDSLTRMRTTTNYVCRVDPLRNYKKDTLCYLNMRNLPFPASGNLRQLPDFFAKNAEFAVSHSQRLWEPSARFADANANDGKLRLPRGFRSGTLI